MKRGILVVLGVVALGLIIAVAFVRLAPFDGSRWNLPIKAEADKILRDGAVRIVEAEPNTLARLDAVMQDMARTHVVAGSVQDGRITYVTRSAVIGFPDFTTIQQDGNIVKMFARLRFGIRDFGVNAARLRQLIDAIK